MATLLHIDTSLNGDTSYSRRVGAAFRQAWESQHPEGKVIYRDLSANPLPHITAPAYYAGFSDVASHTPEEKAAFALRAQLLAEAEEADAIVIGAPLYNYTITSNLKAWIDHIVAVGRTVMADKPSLAGKTVTVITSRGGSYGPGTPQEGNEYLQNYLQYVLGESLGLEVHFIVPELTMAPTNPAMASLLGLHEASLAQAFEEAESKGKSIAARVSA